MYEPVIGLEIHVQAKTKSKMFCSCAADYFGSEPNTNVCPVCLGLPGALPVPNKAAVDQTLKIALALNCEINKYSKFDRKNYFYPDLPKGYQISQYDLPFGKEGSLEIEAGEGKREIRIRRVHLEEDTGKSVHEGEYTYLDYNKSGMPLMEIVTEPDFNTLSEVTAFAKLLRQTVIYTGVSNAEMQKGQMRFELNISLRTNEPAGELPPYRVEVKNIGSISVLEKVIEYEMARQKEILEAGGKLSNETRGLKDMTGETVSQRVKEGENDYRYFPEPDIPPVVIDDAWLNEIKHGLPELPWTRTERYLSLGIAKDQAEVLVDQQEKGDWMDSLIGDLGEQKTLIPEATKWLVGEISGLLEKNGRDFAASPVSKQDLVYLVSAQQKGEISGSVIKTVIAKLFEAENVQPGAAAEIVKSEGLAQVNDEAQIKAWVDQVISENPQVVASIAKNPNASRALIGKVMAASRGRANPQVVEKLVNQAIGL
jgi:aspartyl-tRNA(Asn)/glutamyl-tRNA(Gln) amidotransferase subunit B